MSTEQPPVATAQEPSAMIPGFAGEPTAQAKSPSLGRNALIMALSYMVLSVALSIVLGIISAPYVVRTPTSFYLYFQPYSPDALERNLPIYSGFHTIFGFLIGTWAMVQGIVATAQNRGRVPGIWAIVVAVVAPVISIIVYMSLLATWPA